VQVLPTTTNFTDPPAPSPPSPVSSTTTCFFAFTGVLGFGTDKDASFEAFLASAAAFLAAFSACFAAFFAPSLSPSGLSLQEHVVGEPQPATHAQLLRLLSGLY
jgi:hypothetical protein